MIGAFTIPIITRVVADYYGYTVAELISRERHDPLRERRQVAMYLCREWAGASYPTIGKAFDNRDHTTVMHAHRQIRRRRTTNPHLRRDLDRITALMHAMAATEPLDEMALAEMSEPGERVTP